MAAEITSLTQRLDSAATALKALAHPVRLDVIITLENFEMSVTTLTKTLELKQYTLSKHLRILLEAGLVEMRSVGRTHYYRLRNPELTKLLIELVSDRF